MAERLIDSLSTFSGECGISISLDSRGLDCLVGLRSGDLVEPNVDPPSRKLLISLTLPVCKDCILLCAAPLIRERSGECSGFLNGGLIMYWLSLAFSVKAACADFMALDVFGREATTGEDGFIGSGGGARSGSELSHLRKLD